MPSNSVNKKKETAIDATDKSIGRLASQVAIIIMGKNKVDFNPQNSSGDNVIISNIEKLKLNDKQLAKTFSTHSQYPGGRKIIKWSDLFNKDPKLLFLKVIDNMLPKNRQKKTLLKKISFK